MLTLNYITKKLGIVCIKRTLPKYSYQQQYNLNNISSEIPNVSVVSMKKELASHRLMYEDGNACFTTKCVMCEVVGTQNKNFKVYINKTTGFCSCQCNKFSGSWNIFGKFLNSRNNEKLSKEMLNDSHFKNKSFDYKHILSSTKLLNKLPTEVCDSILEKFNFQITSKTSLLTLNTRIDESHENLYIPLLDLDNKVAGYRMLNATNGSERTLPIHNTFGLISTRASRSGGNSAVVVPSIKDFIALLDAKVPGYVVCLPYGFTNLPQTVLPSFEKFTKIILWFGNEFNAWDTARNFAKKLGEKRCYFVRPTENQPLPKIAIMENLDLKTIITSAQPIWHKAITTFASLRADVLAELQNIDRVQGIKWKRFPLLNKILKGHRRGELTVITGPTGCGKTTFISEYSLDLAMQNVNTLWGSFEIRNARLARTMLQQMSGCRLDDNLDQFDMWADKFEELPIYFMTFHGQQSIKVVMEAVEHATYMHDISHIIIDNVQFMMGITEEPRHQDRFWKQDAIVASFRTFATKKNCHVTLVMHPRKERDTEDLTTSSIFGGAKASQEADNVLIIQDKRLTSVRGKKYLQVVKNRYTGDLGIMPMNFDKSSLSYQQKPKKTDEPNKDKENLIENG